MNASLESWKAMGVELSVKREDLLHKEVSGNKFRKLKYNIAEAIKKGNEGILTFGGAYSNHIAAAASAAYHSGLKSVGIIRGDELGEDLEKTLENNPTLKFASDHGMEFQFLTRSKYREKEQTEFLAALQSQFENYAIVPEGGTNALAVKGCEEILSDSDQDYDVICVANGTGGTISGLINASWEHQKVLGFPALKGGDFLKPIIESYTRNDRWDLITDFHFGGYAKYNENLITFINNFKSETGIPLDPIYTGKMVYGLDQMIRDSYFPRGTKVLVIHTGGLQGIEGFNELLKKKGHKLIAL